MRIDSPSGLSGSGALGSHRLRSELSRCQARLFPTPVTLDQRRRTQFQGATRLDRESLDGPCVVDSAGFDHADKWKSDNLTILGFVAVLLTMEPAVKHDLAHRVREDVAQHVRLRLEMCLA